MKYLSNTIDFVTSHGGLFIDDTTAFTYQLATLLQSLYICFAHRIEDEK